jgi:cell division protease FtsH
VRLILSICDRYVGEIQESSGVRFVLDASVYEQIYANAVFPAQGTRPLFSSIHAILSATLVNAALWALEQRADGSEPVWLTLDAGASCITAKYRKARRQFPVALELNRLKQRSSEDFRALLAVHEAGHGVAYGLLFARAPQEIKINVASFEGGYNSYEQRKAWSKENLRDRICVSLAGRAAEQLVFGEQACTSGATQDFMQATAYAAQYVRHFAFGTRLSRTDVANDPGDNVNTDIEATNPEIEALLAQEHARALALLDAHTPALMAVVDALLREGSIAPAELAAMLELPDPAAGAATDAYAALLATFRARNAGLPPPTPPTPTKGAGAAIPASAARVLRAIA